MPAISSGTTCFFHQNTAPVGWTKQIDIDDHGLRITTTWVEGSQGNTSAGPTEPFSSIFSTTRPVSAAHNPVTTSSVSTTILNASTPPHVHKAAANANITATAAAPGTVLIRNAPPGATAFPAVGLQPVSALDTSPAGGGGHTHPLTLSSVSISASLNFGVKYVDVIRATRN